MYDAVAGCWLLAASRQRQALDHENMSCVLSSGLSAGCACLPQWNYTSIQGHQFRITSGCANPDNDSALPWCPVDPATCTHTPAAFMGRLYWDYCYNVDDKVTIDTGTDPTSYVPSPWFKLCSASLTQLMLSSC